MKAILLAALLSGASSASQDPPEQVRVCVQYIEVFHPALTELLGGGETGGDALHAQAMELAKKGEAKILETAMVVCRSGREATVASILEEIYPAEPEPDELPSLLGADARYNDFSTRSYSCFEVKDTGIRFSTELTINADDQLIDLRTWPELIRRMRLDTWLEYKDEQGDASMLMPVYEKWASYTALSLRSGKSELVSVINPRDQLPPPAVSRRILLFVRADILETPSPQ